MTNDELKIILEAHKKWLYCKGGKKADLHKVNLCGADLHGIDLHEVNLCGADLRGADLRNANLYGADLSGANLYEADLRKAHLYSADLSGTNLYEANLYGAVLYGADLRRADLSGADLRRADLCEANLYGADLYRVNIYGADLRTAKLSGAKNIPFIPIACPEYGSFIAWKKVNGYIIKLQISEDAKRCSATTRKCRCDKALVLAIENIDGTNSNIASITSTYYATCTYTVGEMVYPDKFDDDRWNECSNGIHFFISRQEAVDW